jgi:hypothetical protein
MQQSEFAAAMPLFERSLAIYRDAAAPRSP